jgi:Dienelactone hydrolase family
MMRTPAHILVCYLLAISLSPTHFVLAQDAKTEPYPGTELLTLEGDITSQLVDGVDRFLLKKLSATPDERMNAWPKFSAAEKADYVASMDKLRAELGYRIGMRDPRVSPVRLYKQEIPSEIASGESREATDVRWSVMDGVDAEGLLVQPKSAQATFCAVVIPDAGQSPESLVGWSKADFATAAYLAAQGGKVFVPSVASRTREARFGRSMLTDQEFLYRAAFELGRHLLGYQVQETLAAVDYCQSANPDLPVLLVGWGEGGWVALHASAMDNRINSTCVSGHFGPRENVWDEPIHRNVFGQLLKFGDAQLAAMIAPRRLVIDPVPGPSVVIEGQGGAPGQLQGPDAQKSLAEFQLCQKLLAPWKLEKSVSFLSGATSELSGPSIPALELALQSIGIAAKPTTVQSNDRAEALQSRQAERRAATVKKWDSFTQKLLERMHYDRADYWKNLDTSSIENFNKSVEPYRETFKREIIGSWDDPLLPPKPRSRLVYDEAKWKGYEVVMDVFPDVIAYGVLLVPKNMSPDEKRPCVVFQHGLEGRPQDVIQGNHEAYHDVAAKLAERGFVVFAPQNLYIFRDRFRTLQRKSNPLGRTLFSTIVPQHQQIVKWLGTLPNVDPSRIAFYGLSYGGKSAMRIPPLVPDYCLSICSADFNDWVWKNASTLSPYSYVWTMEYEIFEFDLGPKFNYAEMATLVAPRPFMVERGHFDGVAPDERVGLEYAKVQHLFSAKLKLPERSRIEWFVGPHTVNGQGTYQFLHEKLNWPEPK